MSNRVLNSSRQELTHIALLGLIASITMVIGGSLAGAAEASETGPIWSVPTVPVQLSFPLLPALVLFYSGIVLLVRVWFQLRRFHLRFGLGAKALIIVVAVWVVPLLVGPPLGSRDVYAYGAQGRAAEQGFDIYEAGPAVLGEQHPILVPVDPVYYDAPVVYGPVFVGLSKNVATLAGDGVITSVLLFRFVALLGLGISAVSIYHIALSLRRDPLDALVLGVANPLMLLHLVSGAHNESMMLAFMLGGIAVGLRPRFRLVGVGLCALAGAIKLPALLGAGFLAMPWIISSSSWGVRLSRLFSTGVIVMGVFTAAGELTGFGWSWVSAISGANTVDAYLSVTTVIGFVFSWITGIDVDPILLVTRSVGYIVAISTVLYLLFRRYGNWPEALGWSLFVAALFHPTTQPWYFTWSIGLLAAVYGGHRNRLLSVVCVLASFSVLPSGPRLGYILLDRAGILSILVGVFLIVLLTLNPRVSSQRQRSSVFSASSKKLESQRRPEMDHSLVSVVVPVREQSDQLTDLLKRVQLALSGRRHELIIVDDSSGVSEVSDIAAPRPELASMVTLRRRRWGGAGGAISDGLAVAKGASVIVVDGDLQDNALTMVDLLDELDSGNDLVIASRRLVPVTVSEPQQPVSWVGLTLTRILFPTRTRSVTDPLSGFFAVRLDQVDTRELHPDGPKLLLELLVTHPNLTSSEIPRPNVGRCSLKSRLSVSQKLQILGHMMGLWVRTSRLWAGAPLTQRVFPSGGERVSEQTVPL